MTYPKTILTRKIRLVVMATLITLFFVISPLIIMYTAGYRWDSENKKVKETGVLSIDIKPENSEVFLNEIKIEKKLPLYLPNRAPGNYKLRLSLPGYKTWEKDINIESKKTTYIKDIMLFKDVLPTRVLDNLDNIIDISSSATGEHLAVITQEDSIYEITLFNTTDQTQEIISRTKADNEPEILWSPFANFLGLIIKNGNEVNLQILNADNSTQTKTYTFYSEIKNIQWTKNYSLPTLYLENNSIVYSLDTGTKLIYQNTLNQIWYVEDVNKFWQIDKDDNLIYIENNEEQLKSRLENKITKIIDIANDRLILQTQDNVLILKNDNKQIFELAKLPTQNIFYNDATDEWLTWSPWELWTIYKDGDTTILNRTSNKIDNVLPLDEYGVLLLISENKIIGFNPGYYTEQELLQNGQAEKLAVNIEKRKIFFLGEVAGRRGVFELEY